MSLMEAVSGVSRKQAREQRIKKREKAKQMPKKNRPSRPLPGGGPKTGNPKDVQKYSQGLASMAKTSSVFGASGQRAFGSNAGRKRPKGTSWGQPPGLIEKIKLQSKKRRRRVNPSLQVNVTKSRQRGL